MRHLATMSQSWRRRRRQSWHKALILVLALASVASGALSAAPPPLTLRYEAYAAGLPVLTLDFQIAETAVAYDVTGFVRTAGLLRILSSYTLRTVSRGAVAAQDLRPLIHDTASGSRGKERHSHLDYRGDGTVVAILNPPEDPGRPVPTAQQIIGTVDPLTAILDMSRAFVRSGNCGVTVPIFDGRRRYDVVLTDDGAERLELSAGYGYAGPAHRCKVDLIKISGFSWDHDYSPHTNHGRVWIASPRPDAPPLPLRLEFASDWGPITIKMVSVDPAK